jgi:CheY-like chemotaxis protein
MTGLCERFSGDEAVVIDVLRSYASGTRSILNNLREYLTAENLKDYAVAVHGIKGSSYGIFALEAGKSAEYLENAAKAMDFNAVNNAHDNFAKTTEKLLDDINNALSGMDKAVNNAVRDKKKILIAHNSGAVLRSMKGWLEHKYDIFLANSATTAVKFISLNRPDLILLDNNLPAADGKQALEMLRENYDSADIPVIFTESLNDKPDCIKAADDFFAQKV